MPGYYETTWNKAKSTFESEAGRIIADLERKAEKEVLASAKKKKVSGLRDEKTDAPRLKKPAASGWFGRKSSGMESACKSLDKAAGPKVSEKDKKKAFDDYEKAATKYQKELDDAVNDTSKPYGHVVPQIKILAKRMWAISEQFKTAQLPDERELFGHLPRRGDSEILSDATDVLAAIEKLAAQPGKNPTKRDEKIAILQKEISALEEEVGTRASRQLSGAIGRASKELERLLEARDEEEDLRKGLGRKSSDPASKAIGRGAGAGPRDMLAQMEDVEQEADLGLFLSADLTRKAAAVYKLARALDGEAYVAKHVEKLRGLTGELQDLVAAAGKNLPRHVKHHQKTMQTWEKTLENRLVWAENNADERIATVRKTALAITKASQK
jgi:hypothetical protein